MSKKTLLMLLISLFLLALAACGGGGNTDETTADNTGDTAAVGNAANGEKLFSQATIGANNAPGCITCHSLEPDVVIVGPSQAGLATRAESRVPGMTAAEYIHQSIVEPNAYVVEGFAEGLMYQNYATDLTEQEINDIVAYTLTLK
ncbi:MAG TPA: c-type cytochrome [Promineifilum sp.]|nr:c-type cytochrome [Promineifilum sp.]